MNIKIQGGGEGKYGNKGSCTAVVSYLLHEDMDRAIEGKSIESFFNDEYDKVSSKEVTFKIDQNKSQLHKVDAKFFVITVSPSESELKVMGRTPKERAEALRNYIRNDIMQKYAETFNKNLNKNDILYYSKIHHERGSKSGENMHAHIIVSRKTIDNRLKISPQTNHRNTKKGCVKGGFDRKNFIQACEVSFDKQFGYNRSPEETFAYCNAIKNGSIEQIREQAIRSVQAEKERETSKQKEKNNPKEIEI